MDAGGGRWPAMSPSLGKPVPVSASVSKMAGVLSWLEITRGNVLPAESMPAAGRDPLPPPGRGIDAVGHGVHRHAVHGRTAVVLELRRQRPRADHGRRGELREQRAVGTACVARRGRIPIRLGRRRVRIDRRLLERLLSQPAAYAGGPADTSQVEAGPSRGVRIACAAALARSPSRRGRRGRGPAWRARGRARRCS